MKEREQWVSNLGFILATAGSAIGLGNIWKFPGKVGAYGGGAFILCYVLIVILIGFPVMLAELSIGRSTQKNAVGAFRALNKKWAFVGWIGQIALFVIMSYYCIVGGWVLKYIAAYVSDASFGAVSYQDYFVNFISRPVEPLLWGLVFLAICVFIIGKGVAKGIEKMNKFMMPAFFILFLMLFVRVITLPGAMDGFRYMFVPKWEQLGNVKTWVYALGQAFFSLSVAGSGTIVYGSYLKKDIDVVGCARNVAFFDTCAALLAGMVVIPAVFAFGLDVGSGPPLMFITLPVVFQQLPMGNVFAAIFFVAAIFAAVTSLMNLFETPIEALQQELKLSRGKAVGLIALIAALVGIFIESGDAVGAWMDAVSIYIVPLGALIAAVMFFWVCPKGYAREQVQTGRDKTLGGWFEPVTRYLFVGITFIVYVLGIFFGGIG